MQPDVRNTHLQYYSIRHLMNQQDYREITHNEYLVANGEILTHYVTSKIMSGIEIHGLIILANYWPIHRIFIV